jgi:hypothetical protein
MSNKSKKNILVIILTLSVTLFLVAIYWSQNNNSNAEIVNIKPQKTITPKAREAKDLSFLTEDNSQPMQNNDAEENFKSSKERRKKLSNVLNMQLMYKTPEKVMESIVAYQERGNDDKANELIEFLIKRFPDYDIPDDF